MMNIDSKIKNSKGYAIEEKLNRFFLTKYIFKHNYLTLQKHLETQLVQETAYQLAHAQHRQELEAIQLETVRHLHNFLASALSLIDHGRRMQRKLFKETDPFAIEYQTKIDDTFTDKPFPSFVIGLRQYVQHYQTPKIANVINLVDKLEDVKAKIVVYKADLLLFSGWVAPAKQFISELADELDLVATMEAYYQLILNFQSWLEKRQAEIFKQELDELNALKKQAISEELRRIVSLFAGTDSVDNDAFIYHVTRHFSQEQQEYYDKSAINLKLNYLIWVLSQNQLIASPADEAAIRKKLTY